MKREKPNKRGESGITLIALLVMIVILIILTAVILRTLTGDEPLIGTTAETAEDYKVESYREEISHTVHSEIIAKSAIGETATTGDISNKLNEQEWVKIAYVNPEATADVGNITVQVNEGYVYQVYYNSIYGKIEIDYIGKDIEDLSTFTLIARYEKSLASIYATAEDKKHGIAKIELVYKDEVKQTKDKPTGEQKFDVSEIGTGWYKVKAISNSGAVKYEWVKVTNVSDKLTTPEITIETESIQKNGWYGADKKEVWIKISTNSPSAKTMHYTLSGAQTQAEKIEILSETSEGAEKSIRFQITEIGITNVVAWTQDETDRYQSEEARDSIKYDNKAPEITTIEENGTVGENGWYTSDIELKINAEDLNGKPKTEENTGLETLNGYNYTLLNGEGTELKSKTHITKIDTPIRTSEIAKEDGIYQLHITAEDKAGNESTTKVVTLQKDTKVPTIGIPQITEITETGFQLTISAGDETSGIAYYEYYINNTKIETLTEGIWTPNNLQPNSINNIKVIVYDNAGNKQESINTPVTTKGELKAPNIQISGDIRNGYYIGDVTIQVTDTSEANKTRVNRIKVTGAGSERTITGTSGSFTITADGTYTISAWSEDANGNRSDTTTKSAFTKDATQPSKASLTLGTVAEKTISVTASGADATSGIASYKFEYKLSTASSWNTAATKTSTSTSYSYIYTGLTDGKTYNLRVTVTDKAGNSYTGDSINATTKVTGITPTSADIGKYVNYIPQTGSYTVPAGRLGYYGKQTFQTETDMKWRIWSVEGGYLNLISDRPTNQGGYKHNDKNGILYSTGVMGYNNFVYELGQIISKCYVNNNYRGMMARSIKLEDIEKVTSYDYTEYEERGIIKYGNTKTYNTYIDSNGVTRYSNWTPRIWKDYEMQSPMQNRSEQANIYSGKVQNTIGITLTKTTWEYSYKAEKISEEWTNPKYYELIISPTKDSNYYTPYYLATRAIDFEENYALFSYMHINKSMVREMWLYVSYDTDAMNLGGPAIRPMVSIPLTSCVLKNNGTGGFNINPKN